MKIKIVLLLSLLLASGFVFSQKNDNTATNKPFGERVAESPFVEFYVLEELKALRTEMAAQKVELLEQVMDREHSAIDRSITYATDTITYFFYLIAGGSSLLVLIGWSSIRDIKEKVQALADQKISKLVDEYEKRLENIEIQLNQKTRHIKENREEIELTQHLQALWLRAGQETSASSKIPIYDQILQLRSHDCEALTYKADAVLELGESQWAVNLCHQALEIDPENDHAFYQMACAYAMMGHKDDSIKYLNLAITKQESYKEDALQEESFNNIKDEPSFKELFS